MFKKQIKIYEQKQKSYKKSLQKILIKNYMKINFQLWENIHLKWLTI